MSDCHNVQVDSQFKPVDSLHDLVLTQAAAVEELRELEQLEADHSPGAAVLYDLAGAADANRTEDLCAYLRPIVEALTAGWLHRRKETLRQMAGPEY